MKILYSKIITVLLISLIALKSNAQKVHVSDIQNNLFENTPFTIIGKVKNNYLIYNQIKKENFISVFNHDMRLVKVILLKVPKNTTKIKFLAYENYTLVLYQYLKKGKVELMASKLNEQAEEINEPLLINLKSETHEKNDYYDIINCENNEFFLVIKKLTHNKTKKEIKTYLYDHTLNLVEDNTISFLMNERNDFFTDIKLSNNGTLIIGRGTRKTDSINIEKFLIFSKVPFIENLNKYEVNFAGFNTSNFVVDIDNYNDKYILNAITNNLNGSGIYSIIYNYKTLEWETNRNIIHNYDNSKLDKKEIIKNVIIIPNNKYLVTTNSILDFGKELSNLNMNKNYNYNLQDVERIVYETIIVNGQTTYNPVRVRDFSTPNYTDINRNNIIKFDSAKVEIPFSFLLDSTGIIKSIIPFIEIQKENITINNKFIYFVNNTIADRKILNYKTLTDSTENTVTALEFKYVALTKYAQQVAPNQVIIPVLQNNFLCFAKLDF